MQIEVDYVKQTAVGGKVHGGRKKSQRSLAEHAVIFGRVFPHAAKRPAVAQRDVVKLFVMRDGDAMWSIDVRRHLARRDLAFETRAGRSEANQRDCVRSLGYNVNEV